MLLLYGLPLEIKRFIEAGFLLIAASLRFVKLKTKRKSSPKDEKNV
jgi:hypothetical protein